MKILCFWFLITLPLLAHWKKETIAYDSGKHIPLAPEKLAYTLSWNGAIKSGELIIEFGKKDPRYKNVFLSHAYGRSTGAASILFPYNFTFTSFAKATDYRPLIFVATEKDKKETVKTKNTFRPHELTHDSKTVTKKGRTHMHQHTFKANSPHDLITAMLAIRQQPLNQGDVIRLFSHPFASPYLITVTVLGKEKHLSYPCIKLDIKIQKIDKHTGKLLTYKKLKKATMWISDDTQRIPIELRSKVFIGDVRATLVKRQSLSL